MLWEWHSGRKKAHRLREPKPTPPKKAVRFFEAAHLKQRQRSASKKRTASLYAAVEQDKLVPNASANEDFVVLFSRIILFIRSVGRCCEARSSPGVSLHAGKVRNERRT
jgi:hypothetical protein